MSKKTMESSLQRFAKGLRKNLNKRQYENTSYDKSMDKSGANGKEGSVKDIQADKKALKAMNMAVKAAKPDPEVDFRAKMRAKRQKAR